MSAWAALGGAAGYALGGVPGALIGSSIGGGLDANKQRADIAESANAFSANQYASRYQTQVKDMEAAGLNPMLAYMQSPGASPQGQQYQVTNPYESASRDYSSAYNVQRQGENIESDTDLKASQKSLNDAQIRQVNHTVNKIDAEVDKIEQEILNLPVERRRLEEEVRRVKAAYINLAESSALMAQQGETEVSRRVVLAATAAKLRTENLITSAEYKAMKDTNFIGVTAREVKVLSDVTSEWVDKFLPWKRGRSTTTESESIIRDSEGRVTGRDRYRSTR